VKKVQFSNKNHCSFLSTFVNGGLLVSYDIRKKGKRSEESSMESRNNQLPTENKQFFNFTKRTNTNLAGTWKPVLIECGNLSDIIKTKMDTIDGRA